MYPIGKLVFSFFFTITVISAQAVSLELDNLNLEDGSVEILYDSPEPIAGFQFVLEGVDITGANGGAAADAGFTVSTGGGTVLGFSFSGATLPSGIGIMTVVDFEINNSELLCLTAPVISDISGVTLDVVIGDCLTLIEPPEPVLLSIENVTDNSFDIYMQNDAAVSGFQFDITGVAITSASGGSAEANGFTLSNSETTILGFSFDGSSIPSGDGLLLSAEYSEAIDTEICLESPVISNTNLPPGEFEVILGDCVQLPEDNGCGDGIVIDNCGLCYEGTTSVDNNFPPYGPNDLWGYVQSTSQGFILIDDISVFGEEAVGGIDDGSPTGSCPDQNCDIVSAVYNGVIVGWSYSTIANGDITFAVNLNDFTTPGVENYPMPGSNVNIEFYDASSDIVYNTFNYEVQVLPFGLSEIGMLTIDETLNSDCPLIGCMDDTACNFDPNATVEGGDCEYPEEFFDCENNCLNDQDDDEICDELEVVGCMDDTACNFADSATDQCIDCCEYAEQYYDCDDNCLNDENDNGICDELEIGSISLQVIHNSPSPTVDVYINDELTLESFEFRTATSVLEEFPASFNVGIAPAGGEIIAEFSFDLVDGGSYVAIATGIVGDTSTPFNLAATATTFGASSNDLVGLEVYHGSTDAPSVDVWANENPLLTDFSYGDFSGYVEVPAQDYSVGIAPAGQEIIASFHAPLSSLGGGSAVTFASGYLAGDEDDPGFGLFAALTDGTVLELTPLVQDCNGIWGGNSVVDECGECGGDNSTCIVFDGFDAGLYESQDCTGDIIYGINGYCFDSTNMEFIEDFSLTSEDCMELGATWLPADACYDLWSGGAQTDGDNIGECMCGEDGEFNEDFGECISGSDTGFMWLPYEDFGDVFSEDGTPAMTIYYNGTLYLNGYEDCDFYDNSPDEEECEQGGGIWNDYDYECMVDTEDVCIELGGEWNTGMEGPFEYQVDLDSFSFTDPDGESTSGFITENDTSTSITFSFLDDYEEFCVAYILFSDNTNIFGCADPYDENYDGSMINDGTCNLDIIENSFPEMFNLSDSYPNPFNPVTQLNYTVPEISHVNISVYDISGKLVTELYDGIQKPGVHLVEWNAMNISTGMYMTVMKTGDMVISRKVMLIK